VVHITSDACIGLAESAAEFFPEAGWQRCVVHWYRNIFSHVPSTKVREIAAPARGAVYPRQGSNPNGRDASGCGYESPAWRETPKRLNGRGDRARRFR
jgi:hypothetical protein